jgi:hypothetical protein
MDITPWHMVKCKIRLENAVENAVENAKKAQPLMFTRLYLSAA